MGIHCIYPVQYPKLPNTHLRLSFAEKITLPSPAAPNIEENVGGFFLPRTAIFIDFRAQFRDEEIFRAMHECHPFYALIL